MVLYVEFFMNLFVEYVISCVVHAKDGYWWGFFFVPVLIFVCQILMLLAWQALVVTWNINCDSNGDLESLEGSGTDVELLRKSIMSGKRMMYTFTHGSRALRDAEAEEDARKIRRLESFSQNAITRYESEKVDRQITDILEQR